MRPGGGPPTCDPPKRGVPAETAARSQADQPRVVSLTTPKEGRTLSTSIDQAFVKQFEEEVHQAYQRMGSKLRNTVRVKNGVRGSSTVFQTVGKGSASTKARHGMVPVMNVDHATGLCGGIDAVSHCRPM